MSRTVFMFSGQGSHYFHMGRALYDGNETFRRWMLRLDEVARQVAGQSVLEALYADARGKGEPFDRLLLTHPAIFMVEYALAHALIETGVEPDLVLGVSMGSFAAAAVAGIISVEDALAGTIRQAMALEQWSEAGGMTAVLADPALFTARLSARSELAAINFATHFVVAARKSELAEIEVALKKDNVSHQRLPVAFPFHSRWIDNARAPFASFMQSVPRTPGRLPLVCCDQGGIVSSVAGDYFWDVVRNPIRFPETIARLEQQGAHRYVDVGPAGTLATFLKYGLPRTTASAVHAILTPFGGDQKNLAAVAAAAAH